MHKSQPLGGVQRTDTQQALSGHRVDYLFVSTHSQSLHHTALARLRDAGYRIELSADFDVQSTCFDGFILAVRPELAPVFSGPAPLGREEIEQACPRQLIESLLPHMPDGQDQRLSL